MAKDQWWKDFDAVVAATLPSSSRVLDLGCGDGGFVDRLTELGFDAFGVDPRAPNHPRLVRENVEQAIGLAGFDAITSVMALHHADLDAVVQALTRLRRQHGRLFVYEFGWDAYDDRTADWLGKHGPSSADNSIAGWRREHSDLHTIPKIRRALSVGFEPTLEVKRPYLARMLDCPGLEAEEHALIDAQQLPALGLWYVARRAG